MSQTVKSEQSIAEQRNVLRLRNEETNKITRECICMAMICLANKKPYSDISISELTRKAGVSRTAFYHNYKSKEDVIREIGHEIIVLMEKLVRNCNGDIYTLLLDIFNEIRRHEKEVKLLLRCEMPPEILFPQGHILENVYPSNTTEERYHRIAADAALLGMINEWISTDMTESPEQMAEIAMKFNVNNR